MTDASRHERTKTRRRVVDGRSLGPDASAVPHTLALMMSEIRACPETRSGSVDRAAFLLGVTRQTVINLVSGTHRIQRRHEWAYVGMLALIRAAGAPDIAARYRQDMRQNAGWFGAWLRHHELHNAAAARRLGVCPQTISEALTKGRVPWWTPCACVAAEIEAADQPSWLLANLADLASMPSPCLPDARRLDGHQRTKHSPT